jgi:hypothetical protein
MSIKGRLRVILTVSFIEIGWRWRPSGYDRAYSVPFSIMSIVSWSMPVAIAISRCEHLSASQGELFDKADFFSCHHSSTREYLLNFE